METAQPIYPPCLPYSRQQLVKEVPFRVLQLHVLIVHLFPLIYHRPHRVQHLLDRPHQQMPLEVLIQLLFQINRPLPL